MTLRFRRLRLGRNRVREIGTRFHIPRHLLLALAILLPSACSDTGRFEALAPDATILAFGDSLTAGNGVGAKEAYPAVLASLLDRRVINAGVSGETTSGGVKRLPGLLDDARPDLVILLEGGNDFLRNHDPEITERNLDTMITLALRRDISVVLVGVPRRAPFAGTAELYHRLADRHDIPLEADIVRELLYSPSRKSDGLHFNSQGYADLAAALHELLREEGAL